MTAQAGSVRESLQLADGIVEVEWRRSTRARRISLRIDASRGTIVVTLPMRAACRTARSFLMAHTDWVAARLAALPAALKFEDGAAVPIGGRAHVIDHKRDVRSPVRLTGDRLEVSGDPAFLARRVTDFLRSEARRRLSARVQVVSAAAGVAARRVSVKDTRSRWGSCSADRVLSFSWRLLMAPDFVQDYVVAHEVAHLRHMNHGPEFWRLVGELTPHEGVARDWLSRHGPGLLRIG